MKLVIHIWIFLISIAFFGCATKKIQTTVQSIPSLTFKVDCGKCEYKESGAALITEGYKDAANENHVAISSTEKAVVTITDYNARNSSARFWLGAMAGRDTIKTIVSYKNKSFKVEDFYANAVKGIDDLARNVGEKIFEEMIK